MVFQSGYLIFEKITTATPLLQHPKTTTTTTKTTAKKTKNQQTTTTTNPIVFTKPGVTSERIIKRSET